MNLKMLQAKTRLIINYSKTSTFRATQEQVTQKIYNLATKTQQN